MRFLIVPFLLISSLTWAIAPISPTMKYVTALYNEGKIEIKWANNTSDIDSFLIFRWNPNGLNNQWTLIYSFPAIKPNLETSIILDELYPDLKSNFYKVEVQKDSELSYNAAHSKPYINAHSNIILHSFPDLCSQKVKLVWNKYYGFAPEGTNAEITYYLYQLQDNGSEKVIDRTDGSKATDTFQVVSNLVYNKRYRFIAKAEKTNTLEVLKSSSNCDTVYLRFTDNSQKLLLKKHIRDKNKVSLLYYFKTEVKSANFVLMKLNSSSNKYDTIMRFRNISGKSLSVDSISSRPDTSDTYQLALLNSCGKPSTLSIASNDIIANAELNNSEVTIRWNSYDNFTGSHAGYSIYRRSSNNNQFIKTVNATANEYVDNIANVDQLQNTGELCYYIIANEKNDPDTVNASVQSQASCITLENVFTIIPNVFTPNGDDINDRFKPELKFLPIEYSFVIIDRAGQRIFESKKPGEAWDGKYRNGSNALAGPYMYYLKVKSSNGKTMERTGVVNIIYP